VIVCGNAKCVLAEKIFPKAKMTKKSNKKYHHTFVGWNPLKISNVS
jgi:hypothetical protein